MLKRVVIIGAGFGGLHAARELSNRNVDVLLIDRNNYHTFTPLLYQVATSGLDASEIAHPVRPVFHGSGNIAFLRGEVTAIDTTEQVITVQAEDSARHERYDYLIVAAGSVTNFFGNTAVEQNSFELKSLEDSLALRNHILRLFERAVWASDPQVRAALTTMVVVGGGATGLEMAGALYELFAKVLQREFAGLTPRVVLVEATDKVLAPYPPELQVAAREQLESLGVEVILGSPVQEITADHITLQDGRVIATHTLIWAAGVKASPLAHMLGVPLERGNRVRILPTTEAVGLKQVYVVGDMAYLEDQHSQPYPMLIPVAKQQGILAANNILRQIQGWKQHNFHYIDRGIMATIGRSRAVAYIFNRIKLRGYLAWIAWLGLHLITLLGFQNRLQVFLHWVWNYFTYDRSVRLILNDSSQQPPNPPR